jgi:hypothetical protein
MPQPLKRVGYSGDADKASLAFGALAAATTEATAVLALTLTKNCRLLNAVGVATDQPILLARKRVEADPASAPVFFGAVLGGGAYSLDLRADQVGFHAGDKNYAFAPVALAAGTLWLAAL